MKIYINPLNLLILFAISLSSPVMGADRATTAPETKKNLAYADIADLADASPIIAIVHVQGIKNVEYAVAERPTNPIRYRLVTAKIDSLIRGKDGIPSKVSFLVEKPLNAKSAGIAPDIGWRRNQKILVYARPGNKPGAIQLVSRNAAQKWNAENETVTRAVSTELLAANPAPKITGVGDAFHVRGTVEGESETQVFLKTDTGSPVSISILRRPGEAAHWGVSLSEIVDDTAVPPAPATLLWYRLACSMPATLPFASTTSLSVLDAEAARQDYRFVTESLGSCGRTL